MPSPTLHLSPRDRQEQQSKRSSQEEQTRSRWHVPFLVMASLVTCAFGASSYLYPDALSVLITQSEPGLQEAGMLPALPEAAEPAMPEPAMEDKTTLLPQPVAATAPVEPLQESRAAAPETAELPEAPKPSPAPTKVAKLARAEIAARLYLEGRFKEALSEYRTLAVEHPEQPAYAQFARILRRRIVDTCLLTQPQRAAECEQL